MYELETELSARLDEDADTRRTRQTRDLRHLVAHAQAHSRYWREHLGPLDPDTVQIEDLASVAPLDRSDLQNRWDDMVTMPDLVMNDALDHHRRSPGTVWRGLRLFSTSGSSGEPLLIPLSENERLRRDALATRWHIHRALRGWVPRQGRTALVWGRSPSGLLDATNRQGDNVEILGPGDDSDELRAALNADNWFVLSGYASIIEEIAHWQLDGLVRLEIDTIITGGEPATTSMLDAVDRAWPDVTVLDRYGTTETGSLAHSDGERPGMVLDDDQAIIEIVDGPEGPDHLLVTCLHQMTLPLFRYKVPDRVRIVADAGSGPARHIAHGPLRPEHEAMIGGRRVTAAEIARALTPLGIGPSQLVVDGSDITLHLLAMQHPPVIAAAAAVAPITGPVDIDLVDRLDRDPISEKLSPIVVLARSSNRARRQ